MFPDVVLAISCFSPLSCVFRGCRHLERWRRNGMFRVDLVVLGKVPRQEGLPLPLLQRFGNWRSSADPVSRFLSPFQVCRMVSLWRASHLLVGSLSAFAGSPIQTCLAKQGVLGQLLSSKVLISCCTVLSLTIHQSMSASGSRVCWRERERESVCVCLCAYVNEFRIASLIFLACVCVCVEVGL